MNFNSTFEMKFYFRIEAKVSFLLLNGSTHSNSTCRFENGNMHFSSKSKLKCVSIQLLNGNTDFNYGCVSLLKVNWNVFQLIFLNGNTDFNYACELKCFELNVKMKSDFRMERVFTFIFEWKYTFQFYCRIEILFILTLKWKYTFYFFEKIEIYFNSKF